jgi:hypothetical protein
MHCELIPWHTFLANMTMKKVRLKTKAATKKNMKNKHVKDLYDLEKAELSGSATDNEHDYTDTDEDENEGLGDGKIGKDVHDLFGK